VLLGSGPKAHIRHPQAALRLMLHIGLFNGPSYPCHTGRPKNKLAAVVSDSWGPTAVGACGGRRPTKQTLSPLYASSLQNTNGIGFPMAASTTSHGAAARRSWPRRSRAEISHHAPLPPTSAEAPLLAPRGPTQR
jgi:hypothetical protein